MRLGFVTSTSPAIQAEDTDRPLVEAAVAAAGASAEYPAWDDPDVRWAAFDLVVVRSPWDYPERLDAFLAWLDEVGADSDVRLHNPAPVIRWNLDKRYLADLAAAGIPVVPTAYAATAEDAAAAIATVELPDAGTAQVVVKPTVSAGSRDTGRFERADPAAADLAARIVAQGKEVMVQPAVPSVATHGEVAHVVLDGQLSHAYRKGPLLADGGGLLTELYVEVRERHDPPTTWTDLAVAVHDAACAHARAAGLLGDDRPLLYARVDLVALPSGEPALLECELFEPFLSLDLDETAADRFAAACLARAAQGVDRLS